MSRRPKDIKYHTDVLSAVPCLSDRSYCIGNGVPFPMLVYLADGVVIQWCRGGPTRYTDLMLDLHRHLLLKTLS